MAPMIASVTNTTPQKASQPHPRAQPCASRLSFSYHRFSDVLSHDLDTSPSSRLARATARHIRAVNGVHSNPAHWHGKRKHEPSKRALRHVRRRVRTHFRAAAAFSRRRLGLCPRLRLSCGTRPERRSCSARRGGTCRGSPRASPRSQGRGCPDARRAPRLRPSRICRR